MTIVQVDLAIPAYGGALDIHVTRLGAGPALVYFHPADGFNVDPFVLDLAERYTVYAPHFPGTAPGDPYAIHAVRSLWEVVLAYQEVFSALDLERPVAIGQSFGGMMAAELAATFPGIFERMVLLDPIGLWNDDYPVVNWTAASPADMPGLLFHDPQTPDALALLAIPDDHEEMIESLSRADWSIGCTARFIWPIPDKGLARRLHRITTPTLVVWGENDRLCPVAYADDFAAGIPNSSKVIIPQCGHIPQVERRLELHAAIAPFLS